MSTKYRVWQIGNEEHSEYIYADSHRKAARKFSDKHNCSINEVETNKVGR